MKKMSGAKIEFLKSVREYKKACEANVVSILWKDTDLFFDYNLDTNDFMHDVWQTYFQIGQTIVKDEGKPVLDETTVGLSLETHSDLKAKYDGHGGFETIELAKDYVEVDNIDGYINDLEKWNIVLDLAKEGFPVENRFEEFKCMKAEEIYEEYDFMLNHVFSSVESKDKIYDIADNIHELIDELNDGMAIGLPLYNLPMLTKETGGSLLGGITLIGGLSGMGKSSFIRSTKIPTALTTGEKLVIMVNEEGLKKWQRELIVWVANNVFKEDLQKHVVRDGNYIPEIKDILIKSADWLKEREGTIKLIPFASFSTSLAIRHIKKFSSLGVKYFVLDTFKSDDSSTDSDNFWLNMQQNMVRIYDVVKPDVKNIHIDITFQLSKGSTRQRYYMQDNIGMAKNMLDPASCCLMIRSMFDDEMEGGDRALKVYKLGGKNGRTQIPVHLSKDKHYQIIFIVKNREGASGNFQVVVEHDLSRNVLKEVGITDVPQDF